MFSPFIYLEAHNFHHHIFIYLFFNWPRPPQSPMTFQAFPWLASQMELMMPDRCVCLEKPSVIGAFTLKNYVNHKEGASMRSNYSFASLQAEATKWGLRRNKRARCLPWQSYCKGMKGGWMCIHWQKCGIFLLSQDPKIIYLHFYVFFYYFFLL